MLHFPEQEPKALRWGAGGVVTERDGLGHEGRCPSRRRATGSQAAQRWPGAQAEGSRRPAPSLGSWEPSASLLTAAGALMSLGLWSGCVSGSGHCVCVLCFCVSVFCALEMCV